MLSCLLNLVQEKIIIYWWIYICHLTVQIAIHVVSLRGWTFVSCCPWVSSSGGLHGPLTVHQVQVKDGFPSRSSTGGESPLSCCLSVGYRFGCIHLHSCFQPFGMNGNRYSRRHLWVEAAAVAKDCPMLTCSCVYKPCSVDFTTVELSPD